MGIPHVECLFAALDQLTLMVCEPVSGLVPMADLDKCPPGTRSATMRVGVRRVIIFGDDGGLWWVEGPSPRRRAACIDHVPDHRLQRWFESSSIGLPMSALVRLVA